MSYPSVSEFHCLCSESDRISMAINELIELISNKFTVIDRYGNARKF